MSKNYEEILSILNNNKIKSIELNIFLMDKEIHFNEETEGIKMIFSKKWYEENKELTNKLLLDMIKKYTDKRLSIESGSIINNEIIKEIS